MTLDLNKEQGCNHIFLLNLEWLEAFDRLEGTCCVRETYLARSKMLKGSVSVMLMKKH